jgi:hypothetical protein
VCVCVGGETWKLEGYLKGTGHWKYYRQVVEPQVTEDQSSKHFLVLVIQSYLKD